jgi:aspartate carbamoyltransferase catalytic subunit
MATLTDVISMKPFSRKDIEAIMDLADSYKDFARGKKETDLLANKVLCTLFYEPSTRTRLSFESAILRLGGKLMSVADAMSTSSVWKGESLGDTVRTIENYADVIAMRHPVAGSAEEAAKHASIPIINAGDDANEHPTQALLDLLTIRRERGQIDGLRIAIVGDHKYSRVTKSLVYGLAHYDVNVTLVNPPALAIPKDILEDVKNSRATFEETDDVQKALEKTDVVYIFRIQKERLPAEEYERVKGSYIVNRSMLEKTGREITVMHPMPRVDELLEDVDSYPGACYFRQSFNGVMVRMALLALVLGKATI